ncbi:hypothetical protein Tco_0470340, partial [Tanacetum coccineum]
LELCEYSLLKAFVLVLGWFTIGFEATVLTDLTVLTAFVLAVLIGLTVLTAFVLAVLTGLPVLTTTPVVLSFPDLVKTACGTKLLLGYGCVGESFY